MSSYFLPLLCVYIPVSQSHLSRGYWWSDLWFQLRWKGAEIIGSIWPCIAGSVILGTSTIRPCSCNKMQTSSLTAKAGLLQFCSFSALHQFLFQMKDFCTLSAYCLMHSNGRYCEYYYAAQTVYWRKFMFIVCTFKISKGEELELWSTQKPSPMYYPVRSQMWAEYISCGGGGGVVLFAITGSVVLAAYASVACVINFHLLQSEKYFFRGVDGQWNLISETVMYFAIVIEFV